MTTKVVFQQDINAVFKFCLQFWTKLSYIVYFHFQLYFQHLRNKHHCTNSSNDSNTLSIDIEVYIEVWLQLLSKLLFLSLRILAMHLK